ncbi:uncharacterized protein [Arachis hypogaea]|uniref:uncharacterized protein n=1 Tax=Arachis hypogaea TaxID=3818 RepID=UPI000DEC7E53
MEERKRRCFVAAETPPPLLGLVSVAVLPPSGFCAPAEELEGRKDGSAAPPPSRCVAAHLFTITAQHHRRILCHQFKGVYDFDSDDELQWLIEIQKVLEISYVHAKLGKSFCSKSLIKQSRNRINVIRRKRNSAKKFLKQDTIDLLANHLQY